MPSVYNEQRVIMALCTGLCVVSVLGIMYSPWQISVAISWITLATMGVVMIETIKLDLRLAGTYMSMLGALAIAEIIFIVYALVYLQGEQQTIQLWYNIGTLMLLAPLLYYAYDLSQQSKVIQDERGATVGHDHVTDPLLLADTLPVAVVIPGSAVPYQAETGLPTSVPTADKKTGRK